MRSFHAALIAAVFLVAEVRSISVPTGKETPITPAKSTPRPTYHKRVLAPAPVSEYTDENPEPAPLDPSYVPITYKFIKALAADKIYYIPIAIRNVPFYGASDEGEEPPVVAYRTIEYFPKKYDYKYTKQKPSYYVPKPYPVQRVPTKGGYPKKATAQTDKYYYYENQTQ
ncbi:uncharacterized protein LOC106669188 [Cimex lectularius]|uniref:CPR type cuticle protein n=1 Tax=Cimex lectularius TaxID=79782 RepID=A0A8I6S056_CIMLE|nr:uncharacterized protein LOC106669188 [Cimex lectularius]